MAKKAPEKKLLSGKTGIPLGSLSDSGRVFKWEDTRIHEG